MQLRFLQIPEDMERIFPVFFRRYLLRKQFPRELPCTRLTKLINKERPPVKMFIMAVDFPSTLYKEHIPLLISTIPTNKRQTPNIIFSPLLLLQYIFLFIFRKWKYFYSTRITRWINPAYFHIKIRILYWQDCHYIVW